MPPATQFWGPEDLGQFPMSAEIGKEQGKANGDGHHNGRIQIYGIDLRSKYLPEKFPGRGRFGINSEKF